VDAIQHGRSVWDFVFENFKNVGFLFELPSEAKESCNLSFALFAGSTHCGFIAVFLHFSKTLMADEK